MAHGSLWPSTTLRHRARFWAVLATPTQLVLNLLSSASASRFQLLLAANNLTYATLSPVLSVTTLQVLVLSYNPLGSPPDGIFDKYRLPYLEWLTSQPALFDDEVSGHTQNAFTCVNLPNTTVQSFYLSDQACLWSPGVSKYIIATIVILMFPLALGAALYRYRWHIRLLLYEAYRGRGDRWRRLQEQHFRYDVFVSYDKENLNWVQGHLMPELEDRMGLRLCIHQRDFILGNPIVENITESVQASKKAMLIFSRGFSRSEWCQFELQLCLSHVMENDDALLVVLLEDIPSRDLTPAMMAVMKTMTYIEWEDEPEARASFWGRIRLTLDEILTTFV
nr:hypothetical protein BaRGS_032750 [Batillaria attramentaria]